MQKQITPSNDNPISLETVSLFSRHPGLLLSAAYTVLTFIGVVYYYLFYQAFAVPILLLVDISDILIAGLREPLVILMLAIAVVITLGCDYLFGVSAKIEKNIRQQQPSWWNRLKLLIVYTPKNRKVIYGLLWLYLGYMAFTLIGAMVNRKVDAINQGLSASVLVELASDVDNKTQPTPVVLLGTTTNYVIVYDTALKAATVYTIESIQSIRPQAQIESILEKPVPNLN